MIAERTSRGMKYEAKTGFDDIYDSLAMTCMLFYFGQVSGKGRVPKAYGERQPSFVEGQGSANQFEIESSFVNNPMRPGR